MKRQEAPGTSSGRSSLTSVSHRPSRRLQQRTCRKIDVQHQNMHVAMHKLLCSGTLHHTSLTCASPHAHSIIQASSPKRRDPAPQLRTAGPPRAACSPGTLPQTLGTARVSAAAAPLQPHHRTARRAARPAAGMQPQNVVPLRAVCIARNSLLAFASCCWSAHPC